MSSDNFYTVGGTVQAGGGLYIRRQADDELLQECLVGNYAYILSTRQVGKSSLMVRTAEALAPHGIRSVIVDLSEIGVKGVTAEEWYRSFLFRIVDQLGVDVDVFDWWESNSNVSHTERFTNFFQKILLPAIDSRLVVFIDEIDTTLRLDFTDDFYLAVRYMSNARPQIPEFRRLSFVLIGVASPNDLIQDEVRTPFNIATRVELNDFSLQEALPLAQGFNMPARDAELVLKQILQWTNGHPFLTLQLCRLIADSGIAKWSEADVDALVASTFFGEKSEAVSNLEFVSDMLTKRAPNQEAVLATYLQVWQGWRPVRDVDPSLIKTHLKLSGVVRREHATLRLRNEIYKKVFDDVWVKEHREVNWPRRLQRALIAAVATFLILLLPIAIYGLSQARRAEKAAAAEREARIEADEQRQRAEKAALAAEGLAILQQTAREEADKQKLLALTYAKSERKANAVIDAARKSAEVAKSRALAAAASEREAKQVAETARRAAEAERQRAQISEHEAIRQQGELQKALAVAEEEKNKALRANSRDKLNREAMTYFQNGHFIKASSAFSMLSNLYRDDKDGEGEAWSLANQAAVYKELGFFSNVEKYYVLALEAQKKAGGNEQNSVGIIRDLARFHVITGRFEDAIAGYQSLLRLLAKEPSGAPDPVYPLNIKNELAQAFHACSRSNGNKVNELQRNIQGLGDGPYRQSWIDQYTAEMTIAREKMLASYPQAERLYLEVLAYQEKSLRPDHPNLAVTYENLGRLYEEQGKQYEAEIPLALAREIRDKNSNTDDSQAVIENGTRLALRYYGAKKYHQATILLTSAVDLRYRQLPSKPSESDYANMAEAHRLLASSYEKEGECVSAETSYKAALSYSRDRFAPDSVLNSPGLMDLIRVCNIRNNFERMEPYYRNVVEIWKNVIGPGKRPQILDPQKLRLSARNNVYANPLDYIYCLDRIADEDAKVNKNIEAESGYREALAVLEWIEATSADLRVVTDDSIRENKIAVLTDYAALLRKLNREKEAQEKETILQAMRAQP